MHIKCSSLSSRPNNCKAKQRTKDPGDVPVVGLCGFRSHVCTVLRGPPEQTLEREQNERDVREALG